MNLSFVTVSNPFLPHLHLWLTHHQMAESYHFTTSGVAKAGDCQGTAWCWRSCVSSGHTI